MYSQLYTYQGTTFKLLDLVPGIRYQIVGIADAAEEIRIPDEYRNARIDENIILWDEAGDDCPIFEHVRVLYIPDWVYRIRADNRMFPNLKRIVVPEKNKNIQSFGTMLVINKELKYVFSAGMQDECTVPGRIKRIGSRAFSGTRCTSIRFMSSTLVYQRDAFDGSVWLEEETERQPCSMIRNLLFRYKRNDKVCVIPENTNSFDNYAFNNCSQIEQIVSPVQIPAKCNQNCGNDKLFNLIKKYTITNLHERLELSSLQQFANLEWFEIDEDLYGQYCTIDGVLFSKDKKKLIYYPKGRKDKTYRIPDGTEMIGDESFSENPYLEIIQMPDSIRRLGMAAFYHCTQLRNVNFSDNIESIPGTSYLKHGVFENCVNLCEVKLPSRLVFIGNHAFYNSGIKEIAIPEGVRYIGYYAFARYEQKPNAISDNSAYFEKVRLPSTLSVIEIGAVWRAKEISAFEGTAFGLVEAINSLLPAADKPQWERYNIDMIRNHDNNQVHPISVPIQMRPRNASCLDLAWNGHVFDKNMYESAFHSRTKTPGDDEKANAFEWDQVVEVDGVLFSRDRKTLIHYPENRNDAEYVIPEGTECIAHKAFMNNNSLESVIMPDTVISIGMGAFNRCQKLSHVRISSSLKAIPGVTVFNPEGVFEKCKKLSEISLPSNLRSIGSYAFYDCGIRNIAIPEGVEYIGEYAFASYLTKHNARINDKCFELILTYYDEISMTPYLKSCTLPSTLIHLGIGSLIGALHVKAHEGRTTGLVQALSACVPQRAIDEFKYVARRGFVWSGCSVELTKTNGDIDYILIPKDLSEDMRKHVDLAFNQPYFDAEEYDNCFPGIVKAEEKDRFAFSQYCRIGNKTLGEQHLKFSASKMALEFFEESREDALIALIKCQVLSNTVLRELLSRVNAKNMTSVCAYIMQYIGNTKTKRGRLSL